jgi:hypothetical protein
MASRSQSERRRSADRRREERRRSTRYSGGTLIVMDGITWIDDEGNDRRRIVRRIEDRERIARRILQETDSF